MSWEMQMRHEVLGNRGRSRHHRKQPKNHQSNKKRFSNPTDFSQVYQNPLSTLMPLLRHFSNRSLQDEKNFSRQYEQDYRHMHMRYEYREGQTPAQELTSTIHKFPNRTFENFKQEINKILFENKERRNKSRKTTIEFIESQLGVNIKHYQLLNLAEINEGWKEAEGIVKEKILFLQANFKRKAPLLVRLNFFEELILLISSKKEKKQIKQFKHFNLKEQTGMLQLILCYLSLPTWQEFHAEAVEYQKNLRKVFDTLGNQEEDMRKILKDIPYKESSFYWGKIIDCCRSISNAEHYNDLDSHPVQTFEAEYGGQITKDTLKKLKEGEWLDNTITSAVIQYLKHIEGSNNYHNDKNFRACIFTHSQTNIFMNNPRSEGNYVDYQKYIFLVNHQNTHWFVIVAYALSLEIVVYDSMASNADIDKDCQKINKKLKAELKGQKDFNIILESSNSPKQTNTSDCGVFSIINIICALDKKKQDRKANKFSPMIISEIRHSLFLFLLYLGYCKKSNVVPRKDYFDVLFRSTINFEMRSRLHQDRGKLK